MPLHKNYINAFDIHDNAFSTIAKRIDNAAQRFIDSVTEQFHFTEQEAHTILQVYMKLDVVKIDAVNGVYKLSNGCFWEKDVMQKALSYNRRE